jgi:predicted nucleic acid-binding protein
LISYADSSFVVALYILEVNSAAASRKVAAAQFPVLLTELGEVEFVNALSLRLFRKDLPPSKAHTALRGFHDDVENGVLKIVPLPSAAYPQAIRLATKRTPLLGTRSLDLLHVAAAIALKAENFYTFDLKQSKLATAEGLHVV